MHGEWWEDPSTPKYADLNEWLQRADPRTVSPDAFFLRLDPDFNVTVFCSYNENGCHVKIPPELRRLLRKHGKRLTVSMSLK